MISLKTKFKEKIIKSEMNINNNISFIKEGTKVLISEGFLKKEKN